MRLFTIIGGVNGVGKSSLSGVLSAELDDLGTIIDVDKLTARFGDKLAGGREAVRIISDCLERGLNFTQETTLSGKKTLRTIFAARERGYHIRLFYVAVDTAEESLSRISNRVRKGGHDIPQSDVERRFKKRFDDLAAILPYCDEVVFYDNENGFVNVGSYRDGEIVQCGEYAPQWIKSLKRHIGRNGK